MSESEGTGEECDEVTRRVRASERSDQPTLSFAMRGGSGGTGGAQRRREHPPVSQRAFPRRFTFRLFRLLSLSFRFHTFHHHLPPFPFTPHHTTPHHTTPHHTTPHRQHDALRCTELRIGPFDPNFTCLCLRACPAGTGKVSCVPAHEAHIRSCTRGTLFGPRVSVRGGLARIRSHVMRVCLCRRWPVCLADAGALPVCLADAGAREGRRFLPGIRTYRAPSERGNQHETERSGNGSGAVGGAKKSPVSSTATRMCT